jgi:hypothetical protein
MLCMAAHAVDEFLDVGLGRDRVHHEAVLGSVSRQGVEVLLERLVLFVRLLKDDCNVGRVEFKSCIWDNSRVVDDLSRLSVLSCDVPTDRRGIRTVFSPARPVAARTASLACFMYSAASGEYTCTASSKKMPCISMPWEPLAHPE